MPHYAAWLIDLDGTLYRLLPVKVAMGIELCFASRHVRRVIRAFRREHEALRITEAPNGATPFESQLSRTAEHLNLPVAEVRSIIDDWMFVRPGRWLRRFRRDQLVAEIAQFKANGGRTALVSDYPARVKLSSLAAADLFDVVVANGESAIPYRLKPSPLGYFAAAQQLGVPCSECLVIGDRIDADGAAARQAGMAFRHIH